MSWVDILKAPIGFDVPDPQKYYEYDIDRLKEILDDWDKDDPVNIIGAPMVSETDTEDIMEGGVFRQSPRGSKEFVYSPLRFITDRPIPNFRGLQKKLGDDWTVVLNTKKQLMGRYGEDAFKDKPNAREYFIRPSKDHAKRIRDEMMPSGKTREAEMEERGYSARYPATKRTKESIDKWKKERDDLGIKSAATFIDAVKDYPTWVAKEAINKTKWFSEAWKKLSENILDETTANKLKSMLKENNLENHMIDDYRVGSGGWGSYVEEPIFDVISVMPFTKYRFFSEDMIRKAIEDLTKNKNYMDGQWDSYRSRLRKFKNVYVEGIIRPALKQYWDKNFKTIITDVRNTMLEEAKETIERIIKRQKWEEEQRIEDEKREAEEEAERKKEEQRIAREKEEERITREKEEQTIAREKKLEAQRIAREKEEHRQRSLAGQGKWGKGKPQSKPQSKPIPKKEIKMPENIPVMEDTQRKPRRKKRPKSQLTDAEFNQKQYDRLKRDLKNAKRNQPKKVIQELERKIANLERNNPNLKKSFIDLVLNKAIIETEFVRDYPQYVTEMKEEMKFGNMDQPEAELKVAKKYRLPILSKLQGRSGGGRWTRMLKLAGVVTSTHAGIESKPRYSKKKKEEDEE